MLNLHSKGYFCHFEGNLCLGGHFTRATGSCTSGSSIRAYFAWLGITSGLRAGVIGASSTSGWLLLSLEGNLCVGGCMGISGHHSMLENRFASRDCSLYRHSTTNSDYNHWAAHTERIFGCWGWIIMHYYTYRLILPVGAFTPLTTLGPIYNIYTRRFYPSTSYSGSAWAAR